MLEEEEPPQPVTVPKAASNSRRPSMALQLRRREGIPRKTSRAKAAPPPRCIQPFCLPSLTGLANAVVAPTVVTVAVAVTEEEPLAKVTDGLFRAHVGRSMAPLGESVNAQLRATVPEYAVLVLTVTVEAAEEPAVTAVGAVVATAKSDWVSVGEVAPEVAPVPWA